MSRADIFDLDASLKEDPATKDFKELYNQDAVNQSIDVFLQNPYRIGVGLINHIFDRVFTDLTTKTALEVEAEVRNDFSRNMTILQILSLTITPLYEQRKLKIQMVWQLRNIELDGTYQRYWSQAES